MVRICYVLSTSTVLQKMRSNLMINVMDLLSAAPGKPPGKVYTKGRVFTVERPLVMNTEDNTDKAQMNYAQFKKSDQINIIFHMILFIENSRRSQTEL